MAAQHELAKGYPSTKDQSYRYDVFISFRGVDTRLSFTDHLYNALVDANISTFLDNEEIETGDDLKPELQNAIKSSRASVIVLSKNYATSTWCLDELALILEQRLISNHIVIPIWYHVERNSLRDVMEKHRERIEAEAKLMGETQLAQKMEAWNKALKELAKIKGMDAKGRMETKFIQEIVQDIYHRLDVPVKSTLPLLIGMDDSVEFLTSWLNDGSSHPADILTILGMGGIGKTSLAKYVYGLHWREYRSSFIEDISRRCSKLNGLPDVKKQLCDDISKRSSVHIRAGSVNTSVVEHTLTRKKMLLVLDDIDSLDQLDALVGNKGFHPGSKIIITTKDASLTERCALFKSKLKPKHTKWVLKGLSKDASLELLCCNAFSCKKPKEGYEEVSKKVSKYCEGHPLALEVLGKTLYNRAVDEWEDYIERLKKETDPSIKKVLQMSFDSLSSESDQELFKHIACFFVGKDRDVTETILKACNINTRSGIRNLVDRCLLSIGRDNELMMHQLLQEMGRDEVRKESPKKPWKRSRLWSHEESYKVLKQKKDMENILGLILDTRVLEKGKLCGSFEVKSEVLSKMDNIMLLQLNYVQIKGTYKNFPEELRWLCMHGFPLNSIPSDLALDNLVALDLSYSNVESFGLHWSNPQPLEGGQKKLIGSSSMNNRKFLASLKILNMSFCEKLHKIGGFLDLPALERLIVRNCICVIEICESLEQCVELVLIDLRYCNKLKKLPTAIGKLKKVKTLLLDGCNSSESQIENRAFYSPEILEIKNIGIDSKSSSSALMEAIPSDLYFFRIPFPNTLVRLSLANNSLSNESFPVDLSYLSMLKELHLDNNPIVSLPNCLRSLPRLEILCMRNCKMLMSIINPPCTLKQLILFSYENLLHDYKLMIQRFAFDPEFSPLNVSADQFLLVPSSFEIEGMLKIQPMECIEEKVLRSLGWTNLDFIKKRRVKTCTPYIGPAGSQTQMYYEFGIFSTIYGGNAMPYWIRHRSKGPSISFTIPSSPNKVRGLNFCYVQKLRFPNGTFGSLYDEAFELPMIIISNRTKNRNWIYHHCIDKVSVGHKCLTFLSHWTFRTDEMEGDDHVTITVTKQQREHCDQLTEKCGVSLVYDEGKVDEDTWGYYKSWNHIIRGDLSAFHLTEVEYILYTEKFMRYTCNMAPYYGPIMVDDVSYKDEVCFKAFSRRKSNIFRAHLLEGATK
uniref:disease resistance protein RUN1-like isoform X2 n=1 Tax=Erigeron canadensis TaxID=72917 RepID=UPI001CB8DE83|nr:disease resistance protein RUN1-like isoform X2 [Erigeron canadensis]